MEERKRLMSDFGIKIKMKLLELNHSQNWLIEEVKAKTGLYFDSSYLYRIMTSQIETPKIIQAIHEILELDDEYGNS